MSKAVKDMVIRDYRSRLGEIEDAMVISIRGIGSNDTNVIRAGLAKKRITVTVVRNSLALKAVEGRSTAAIAPLMTGSNALAYGAESVVEVAREILELVKKFPGIELKGAVLDGELFEGQDGVERLSKFPTRDEAIAQTVTLILSPARKLVSSIKGPGARLASLIKAIEEKLEKGEAIARVG